MTDKISIQLTFQSQTSHGEFRDALYFTLEEWADIKEEDLTKKKQERIDNWINILENPVTPKEPTKEELTKQKEEIELQIASLENRKTELTSLIASKING